MPRAETRLTEDEKSAFSAFCRAQQTSEADMIRRMIQGVSGAEAGRSPPAAPEPKAGKVTVRLTAGQLRRANERARAEGYATRTGWVTALVLGALHREPVLTDAELDTLRQSNRELSALGRNLNQLAKALNIEFRASDRVKREQIEALAREVEAHSDRVAALLDRNMNRWNDHG